VALGGSLHQRLQDLPDRIDHSTPMSPLPRVRTGKSHGVRVTPGSWLHRIVGRTEIGVNSLHNQGVDRLAPSLVADAVAPDGIVEAVHATSPGFAVGVQWHPEYDWERDEVSRQIFVAFGDAVRARMAGPARLSSAAD
jgi:putative glutamine amidotransferase